jgi:hypothetical protein
METPTFVPQYQGEVRLIGDDNRITLIELTANDLHKAKEIITRMLGEPRADFRQDTKVGCTLVFHLGYQRGRDPVAGSQNLKYLRG